MLHKSKCFFKSLYYYQESTKLDFGIIKFKLSEFQLKLNFLLLKWSTRAYTNFNFNSLS